MMKTLRNLQVSLLILFSFIGAGIVLAPTVSAASGTCKTQGITILPAWYKYVDKDVVDGKCTLNFDFPYDIGLVLLAVVEILLRLAAMVAVAYVVYAGFLYMTSQGEPDKAKSAQQTITNAVIGLVIAILATGIVSFIGGRLTA